MHFNAAVESTSDASPEDPTDSVPCFHFLNLKDDKGTVNAYGGWPPDDKIAEFLEAGDNGCPTLDKGTETPDEDIEALLFGAANNKPPD